MFDVPTLDRWWQNRGRREHIVVEVVCILMGRQGPVCFDERFASHVGRVSEFEQDHGNNKCFTKFILLHGIEFHIFVTNINIYIKKELTKNKGS